MHRLLSVSLVAFALSLVACPTEGPDAECGTYIWEYTCDNGTCSCDDDVASCVDPDDTTADDPDSCENVCIECAD